MTTRAREVETLLDWLRGEARDWKTKLPHEPPEQFDAWTDSLSALIAECETAKAELAEAVKVMAPFAEMYSTALDPDPDRTRACLCIPVIGNFEYITLGDLRAARTFIARQKEGHCD